MNGSVEIKDLCVSFSQWGRTVTAVDRVDIVIPTGQWVMLIGPNGSGKSTILNALSRRLVPNVGEIQIDGQLTRNISTSKLSKLVFHVHQDPLKGTAPKLTLFENLLVADRSAFSAAHSKHALERKYIAMLDPLGMAGHMKQLVRSFSGGERQLIALLIAQLRDVPLILLDEPMAALDPNKTDICLDMIKELHKRGVTIIQVCHDPDMAVFYGDRTIGVQAGRTVYDAQGKDRQTCDVQRVWLAEPLLSGSRAASNEGQTP